VLSPVRDVQNIGGLSFQLEKNQRNEVYYPVIPFFIGDNKELCTLSGVRHGPKTMRQCRICITHNTAMHTFKDPQEDVLRRRTVVCAALDHPHRKENLKDLSVSANIMTVSICILQSPQY
jgi:hypothetical protein